MYMPFAGDYTIMPSSPKTTTPTPFRKHIHFFSQLFIKLLQKPTTYLTPR